VWRGPGAVAAACSSASHSAPDRHRPPPSDRRRYRPRHDGSRADDDHHRRQPRGLHVETLTTIDEAGRILPLLAEGWTVSADGRQYTFKLHPGVRFHDGSPFDAKASVELRPADRSRCAGPDPRCLTDREDGRRRPADGPDHAQAPYAAFLGALSSTTSGLLSPASAVAPGNDYKSYVHIVEPVRTRSRSGGGREPHLRAVSRVLGRPTSYESVVVRIVPEAATRESLLLAGQVDLIICRRSPTCPRFSGTRRSRSCSRRATGRSSSRSTPGSRCSPTGACGRRSTTRWTRRRS